MSRCTDEGAFVDLIYDAAVEPDLWPALLEQFADRVGGDSAMLMWQNQLTGAGFALTTRLDPGAYAAFFGHFAAINPLRAPPDVIQRRLRNFVPRVVTDEHRIAKSELMRTEFYNDFMRPFDIHSTLTIGLAAQGQDGGTVDVTRSRRRGRFTEDDLALSQRLQPHLVRAFRLGRKVSNLRGLGSDLAWTLDQSPHGLLLVGRGGLVRHMNRAAETLVTGDCGLTVLCGRLGARAHDLNQRLSGLIHAATSPEAPERTGGSLALASPTRRFPLSINVAPVRTERFRIFDGGAMAMVCVADLEAEVRLTEQKLQDLFGLTRAEARVALALFDGLDPRGAADRLGLSVFTVRGHLVRIFEKTDTHSQVELARLMMRAA